MFLNRMKGKIIISSLILAIIFTSCEPKQSVHTDSITGSESRESGLACDNVNIEIDKKIEKRNEFIFGEEVSILFNDIVGFKKMNSTIFPGLSLYIINSNKDTVQATPDLFDSKGINISPVQLKAKFTVVFPRNEQYELHIKIWDKKGDGTFTYQLPFTVTNSKLLDIRSNQIEFSNIYLWNQTKNKPVTHKAISQEDTFILILEGLKGLNEIEGNVFPIFSIELIDSKGQILISNPNLLKEVEKSGVEKNKLFVNQLTAKISFNQGVINNPCVFNALIKDGKSNKKIQISANLEIDKFSF